PGGWKNQQEPQLVDRREQVLDAMTAYQITSMMEGVVQAGTATVLRDVGKPLAGKTGTTNEAKDAWFIGFSPDIVVGIYLGYDKPRPLGKGNAATGGHLAAPIARDFLKLALADKPVQGTGWDQAGACRCQDRHAGGSRQRTYHIGSFQTGNRAAG